LHTCRTTFLPARDLPQMWVKPRKVNEVPFRLVAADDGGVSFRWKDAIRIDTS
jgi:hypothetical protein